MDEDDVGRLGRRPAGGISDERRSVRYGGGLKQLAAPKRLQGLRPGIVEGGDEQVVPEKLRVAALDPGLGRKGRDDCGGKRHAEGIAPTQARRFDPPGQQQRAACDKRAGHDAYHETAMAVPQRGKQRARGEIEIEVVGMHDHFLERPLGARRADDEGDHRAGEDGGREQPSRQRREKRAYGDRDGGCGQQARSRALRVQEIGTDKEHDGQAEARHDPAVAGALAQAGKGGADARGQRARRALRETGVGFACRQMAGPIERGVLITPVISSGFRARIFGSSNSSLMSDLTPVSAMASSHLRWMRGS